MFKVTTRDGFRTIRFDADVDSGEAYDATQCDDRVKDGDVLIVPREGILGFFALGFLPIAVHGGGEFHKITDREGFLGESPQYAEILAYCEGKRAPRRPAR